MALTERLAILIDASSGGAVREFQKLSGAAGQTDTALSKGAVAAGAFKGALGAIGLTTIAAGMLQFAQASMAAASALEEAENKARVVFGSAFPEIQKFATDTANALNLSERAAYDLTASLAPLFKSAGYGSQDVAKLSQAFAAFAADFASFNNLAPEEAFQKILSGLSGEVEPLRRYGIQLSAAKVEAEAYSSGIAQVGTQLTEGQKIQARANIILKEGATALGDVERTADSYANVQRDLKENTEDLAATFGGAFTPEVSKSIQVVSNLVGVMVDLGRSAEESGGAFDTITSAVTSAANPLSNLWDNFTNLRDSIIGVTEATGDNKNATKDTTTTLYEQAAALLESTGGTEDLTSASGLLTSAAETEEKAISDLAQEIANLGSLFSDADAAQDSLTQSIVDAGQPVRDLEEADRNLQDATLKVASAAGEAERAQALEAQAAAQVERDAAAAALSLTGNSEAALSNRDALRDLASKTLQSAAALVQLDGDTERAAAETQRGRDAFIAVAQQLGYTKQQAEAYANQLGLIRKDVTTAVQLSGAGEAISAAQRVRDMVNQIPLSRTVSVRVDRFGNDFVSQGGPTRGSGGPVSAGQTYMVGEGGPELLTMRGTNGFITSSGKTNTTPTAATQTVYNVYGYPDDHTLRALEQQERRRALTRRLAGV